MIKAYYYLTKPGLVYGNALAGIAGYFVAARGSSDFGLISFVAMTIGLSLVMASSLVINNVIDRGLDKRMARTKKRALVTGQISVRAAVSFGVILGLIGAASLAVWTNWLTMVLALFGWFAYVVLYGIGKRHTPAGTLIGSISGSVPPVVGYAAFTDHLNLGALLLFLLLVAWQMPHFYGIALYRLKDYKAAGLPVLPVVRGVLRTELSSLFYIALYICAVLALTVLGYTGWLFGFINVVAGAYWLLSGTLKLDRLNGEQWGRATFGFSLWMLLILSVTLIADSLITV